MAIVFINLFIYLQLIDTEINPHVDEWEAAGRWPAHKILKLFGQAGYLGITKPVGKFQTCFFKHVI